jgi:hypothetical protein
MLRRSLLLASSGYKGKVNVERVVGLRVEGNPV